LNKTEKKGKLEKKKGKDKSEGVKGARATDNQSRENHQQKHTTGIWEAGGVAFYRTNYAIRSGRKE